MKLQEKLDIARRMLNWSEEVGTLPKVCNELVITEKDFEESDEAEFFGILYDYYNWKNDTGTIAS